MIFSCLFSVPFFSCFYWYRKTLLNKIYLRGHSITAWIIWGGGGQKVAKFCPRSCWMPPNLILYNFCSVLFFQMFMYVRKCRARAKEKMKINKFFITHLSKDFVWSCIYFNAFISFFTTEVGETESFWRTFVKT